jgi:hypothetical protein
VTVNAGVPVVAAIEGRVVKPGFYGKGAVGEGDAGLVGEFALHAAERKVGEVGGAGGGEIGLTGPDLVLRLLGRRGEGCCQYDEDGGSGFHIFTIYGFWFKIFGQALKCVVGIL